MSDVTYIDAIHAALDEAMERDPDVFLYGQDIGKFGGAFKATKGLQEKYPGRVLDAPISEDAMAGVAIGAAIEGARPVLEMQFADFSSVALNQIINQAATHYYRTGVPVPLTMRLPSGEPLVQVLFIARAWRLSTPITQDWLWSRRQRWLMRTVCCWILSR